MKKQNDEFKRVLDHVLGKKSVAWKKWLGQMTLKAYNQGTELDAFIIAACIAVLLKLGPPPNPEWLTSDTTQVYPHPKFKTRHERIFYENWMKIVRVKQHRWNKAFNEWAIENRLYGSSRGHGPAQMRKFFAAWWLLHRSKDYDGREKEISPLSELAATRDALEKHTRVLHRAASRKRPPAKLVHL